MVDSYNDKSIEQLKGAERIRVRPAAVLGSDGIDGAKHGVIEILGNALDEASSGFGSELHLRAHDDGSISIRDFGRGIPLGWNEPAQAWNYFLIFEEMYAGGKYSDSQAILKGISDWSTFNVSDHSYLFSVGLNGLGAMATQCSSEWFTVTSYRDGVASRMDYALGEHTLDELVIENSDEANGTFIHWKPDATVFTDVDIDEHWLHQLVRYVGYTAGIKVIFTDRMGDEHVYEPSDIPTLFSTHFKVDEGVQNVSLTHTTDSSGDVCVALSDLVVGPGEGDSLFFHNLIQINGGVHLDGMNTSIINFFTERGRERGVKFALRDFSNLLSVVISSKSNKVSYRSQTKDSLDNTYVLTNIMDSLSRVLREAWARKESWLQEVVEEAISNADARQFAADQSAARKQVQKVVKTRSLPEKFVSCTAYSDKNPDNELWLLEGESAASSFQMARDASFQCYLPLKGKGLNVYKSTVERILRNKEIRDLIQILGCGVDLGLDSMEDFNIDRLRCNKIIIASDADVDGFHIRILIFLIFYKLFPQILEEGYLYVAETPLYELTFTDGSKVYCRDEKERDEAMAASSVPLKNHGVKRFKGLGQVSNDVLKETTVHPASRNLVQIKVDRNDMEVFHSVDALFGADTSARKSLILGNMLGFDIDELQVSIDEMLHEISEAEWDYADTETVEF